MWYNSDSNSNTDICKSSSVSNWSRGLYYKQLSVPPSRSVKISNYKMYILLLISQQIFTELVCSVDACAGDIAMPWHGLSTAANSTSIQLLLPNCCMPRVPDGALQQHLTDNVWRPLIVVLNVLVFILETKLVTQLAKDADDSLFHTVINSQHHLFPASPAT